LKENIEILKSDEYLKEKVQNFKINEDIINKLKISFDKDWEKDIVILIFSIN